MLPTSTSSSIHSPEERAQELFEALFCYGEEAEVWFSRAAMAYSLGWTEHDIGMALLHLRDAGRIVVTTTGDDVYARQSSARPWQMQSVGTLLRAQDWSCAVCKTSLETIEVMVDFGETDRQPPVRIVCAECWAKVHDKGVGKSW
jgi:hypothetical protein